MIGDRIKLVRQTVSVDGKKLSQEAFGEILGVTRPAIANIELGRVEQPSDLFINHLCNRFNVDEHWLRTGEGDMFAQLDRDEEISNFVASALKGEDDNFRKRFLSMLTKLDESEWELLEKMAKKMAGE